MIVFPKAKWTYVFHTTLKYQGALRPTIFVKLQGVQHTKRLKECTSTYIHNLSIIPLQNDMDLEVYYPESFLNLGLFSINPTITEKNRVSPLARGNNAVGEREEDEGWLLACGPAETKVFRPQWRHLHRTSLVALSIPCRTKPYGWLSLSVGSRAD